MFKKGICPVYTEALGVNSALEVGRRVDELTWKEPRSVDTGAHLAEMKIKMKMSFPGGQCVEVHSRQIRLSGTKE